MNVAKGLHGVGIHAEPVINTSANMIDRTKPIKWVVDVLRAFRYAILRAARTLSMCWVVKPPFPKAANGIAENDRNDGVDAGNSVPLLKSPCTEDALDGRDCRISRIVSRPKWSE